MNDTRILSTIWIFLTAGLCLVAGVLPAQEKSAILSVDRNQVSVNQQIQVEIEFRNVEQFPRFEFDPENFDIVSGPSRSTSFQWINGRTTSSKKLIYVVLPREPGEFTLGPYQIRHNGQLLHTNSVAITVGDANQSPSRSPAAGNRDTRQPDQTESDPLFIEAIPNKTSVYRGEQITVTYRLYTRVSIRNYGINKSPDATGFWKEDIQTPNTPRLTQEVRNGIRYSTAVIKKMAYFPTKSGSLSIEPLVVNVEVQPRRGRSMFDDFFSNPFGRGVTKKLTSNAVSVEVKPVPTEGQPDHYTGAVGQFTISAEVDTPVTTVDEAVGMQVEVTGTGNIPMITLPEPAPPSNADMFDPEVERETSIRDGTLSGAIRYRYVFIPRKAGELILPSIPFTYFNPEDEGYHTLTVGGDSVGVKPLETSAQLAEGGYSREEVELLNTDIRYLKAAPGRFQELDSHFYSKAGFYLLVLLGISITGGSLAYRYWYRHWGQDRAYLRRRRAVKNANRHIREAEDYHGRPEYYSRLSKAVVGFVGDKCNTQANALETEELKTLLHRNNVPESTIKETDEFLQECDAARFAPAGEYNGAPDEFAGTAKSLVRKLNKYL